MNKTKTKHRFDRLLQSLASERSGDYSGRIGRDERKKRIGKANKKGKSKKRTKDEEMNGQGKEKGRKGVPRRHTG